MPESCTAVLFARVIEIYCTRSNSAIALGIQYHYPSSVRVGTTFNIVTDTRSEPFHSRPHTHSPTLIVEPSLPRPAIFPSLSAPHYILNSNPIFQQCCILFLD
jgi:hypothetical protein